MTTPYGEGAQSGAEGTQSGAGESTGESVTETSTSGESAQSGAEQQPQTQADMVERAALLKQQERTRAADERAAKLDQELKQLRDKDLPEIQRLQRDYQASQEQVKNLQTTNQSLALQVAFLKDNTYSWHNPETALKLVDLSQVTVEEDGSVSGLKDALKALATSNDYLVKKEATSEAPKPPSTTPANNGTTGNKPTSSKAMALRLPALNTRPRRS